MHVLIVDDDATTRYLLQLFSRDQDFTASFASTGREAIEKFSAGDVDLVITDVRMPDIGGEFVLGEIKARSPMTPVLIMTAHGSIDDAVRFLKEGAQDYIQKPISREVFLHRIHAALERLALSRELEALRATVSVEKGRIIGQTPALTHLLQRLPMTAQTDASVVIYGESGTGKELVAERIHELSKRKTQSFVTVNCGALSDTLLESELFGYKRGAFTDAHRDTPGLVEEAEGGTLFLDEIGEVSPAVQVKLLRFLQAKEYKALGSPKINKANVRIVAATNRDLLQMVDHGLFREDLYYRLNVVPLTVPPLRERKNDIPLLATHFLNKFRREYDKEVRSFHPDVMASLTRHDWPGNVRELENKVQQMVVLTIGDMIEHLHTTPNEASVPQIQGEADTFRTAKKRVVENFERDYVTQLLARTQGNLSEAARIAGVDRKNFWVMAKKYGLRAQSTGSAMELANVS